MDLASIMSEGNTLLLPSHKQAYLRAFEIENEKGSPCGIWIEADGDNWKITVTRASDGDVTVEYMPRNP